MRSINFLARFVITTFQCRVYNAAEIMSLLYLRLPIHYGLKGSRVASRENRVTAATDPGPYIATPDPAPSPSHPRDYYAKCLLVIAGASFSRICYLFTRSIFMESRNRVTVRELYLTVHYAWLQAYRLPSRAAF